MATRISVKLPTKLLPRRTSLRLALGSLLVLVLLAGAVAIGYVSRPGGAAGTSQSVLTSSRPADGPAASKDGSTTGGDGSTGAGPREPATTTQTVPGPAGSGQSADAPSRPDKTASGSSTTGERLAPGYGINVDIGPNEVIRTASISIVTKDVTGAANSAVRIITDAAGQVASDTRVAPDREPGAATAQLVLKVAPDRLEPTLSQLSALGTERERRTSSQDATNQVADVASRVASSQASIARLQALYARAGSIGEIVSLEGQLASRQSELESLQARQRALAAQTTFATITLNLTSPAGEPTTSEDESTFAAAWRDAWNAFGRALGWGLTGLAVMLPFAVVLPLAGWFVQHRRRRATRPDDSRAAPAGQPAN